MKNQFLKTKDTSCCYGCSMCQFSCPVNAISMKEDDHGFLYPEVDEDLCTNCGKCRKVCPFHIELLNKSETIYQVAHKKEDVLLRSQCGGCFTALSDITLSKKGVIYGAVINDNLTVEHQRASDANSRDNMCGSKYVQSIISEDILHKIDTDIKTGVDVLFTGTPCQCAMIKKNYEKYNNLFVCDFICHGVPSPKLWHKYIENINACHNKQIEKVTFRLKRCTNLGNYTEFYLFKDKTQLLSNDYAALFYSHLAHRNSCFSCQFASLKRYSDITIGGFLEPSDFYAPYDSSMLIINTPKGRDMFNAIKQNMNYVQCDLDYFKNQPCLYHPIPMPKNVDEFWKDFSNMDIVYLIKKYATEEIKTRYKIEILRGE